MVPIPIVILAIENDDDRAFMIQAYMDFRWFMYSIAYEIVQDHQIAEDMVSQAICEMIDALDDIRKIDHCKLKSYIATLIRNDSIDFVRKRNRQGKYFFLPKDEVVINNTATDEEIDAALIRSAEIAELRKGLARLSDRERIILTMKYLDGAPDEDIAKVLGIATASVQTYLTRARRHLCLIIKEGEKSAH